MDEMPTPHDLLAETLADYQAADDAAERRWYAREALGLLSRGAECSEPVRAELEAAGR